MLPPPRAACALVYLPKVYHQWRWPDPVLLRPFHRLPPELSSIASAHAVWNPKVNPRDRAHGMPIITPAFPEMNSSYNVSDIGMKRERECDFAYERTALC